MKSEQNTKFKVGDKVRVSKIKRQFEKGYLPNWSEEVFFIKHVVKRKPDYDSEQVCG